MDETPTPTSYLRFVNRVTETDGVSTHRKILQQYFSDETWHDVPEAEEQGSVRV